MVLQNCWNFSEAKFVPVSDISFWAMPYLANITFVTVIKLSADKSFQSFDNREFAVVIYNA